MNECPECGGDVYNPPGLSEGHLKCRGCGTFFHPVTSANGGQTDR